MWLAVTLKFGSQSKQLLASKANMVASAGALPTSSAPDNREVAAGNPHVFPSQAEQAYSLGYQLTKKMTWRQIINYESSAYILGLSY